MKLTSFLLGAGLAVAAYAQPAGELPEFEAASIKVNKSGSGSSSSHDTAGQLVAINMTLRDYIRWAFAVRDYQIEGPDWLRSEHFDVIAKFPPHTGDNQVGLRLQRLLAERFKLAVHSATKEFPVYALVQAKNGAKLTPVDNVGGSTTNSGRGTFKGQRTSMARIAEFLSRQMERPVIDRTELKGVYDIKLEWVPDAATSEKPGDPAMGPDLLTALQQQLGLKLQPQKEALAIIVVDHAEKVPIEN